jgi:hypothetical protein
MGFKDHRKIDHVIQMITLSMITMSSCIVLYQIGTVNCLKHNFFRGFEEQNTVQNLTIQDAS